MNMTKKWLKTVLVVDDSYVAQVATKFLFEQIGCFVVIAKDGKAAIKAAEKFFDLVLLDLHLPDIDGVLVAKTIKEMEEEKNQSKKSLIVAYTAYEKKMKEEYVKNYFDDFITKPISEKDARRLIERLLLQPSNENN